MRVVSEILNEWLLAAPVVFWRIHYAIRVTALVTIDGQMSHQAFFLLERNTQHRQPFRSCMVMVLWKCWSRLMQQHLASDEDIAMLDIHEPASSSSYKSILTQFSRSSRIQPTPLHGFGDISLIQSRNEVIIIVVTMILLLKLNLPWFLLLVLLILRLI